MAKKYNYKGKTYKEMPYDFLDTFEKVDDFVYGRYCGFIYTVAVNKTREDTTNQRKKEYEKLLIEDLQLTKGVK